MNYSMKTVDRYLVFAISVVVGFIWVSFFFSEWSFLAHLISQFQLQYAGILVVLGCIVLARYLYRVAVFVCIILFVQYFFFLHPVELAPQEPEEVDVFYMNLMGWANQDMGSIVQEIELQSPRIVATVETNEVFLDLMEPLYGRPHVTQTQWYLRCAIFSQEVPLRVETREDFTRPVCIAEYVDMTVVVIHSDAPTWRKGRELQKIYLQEVADLMQQYEEEGMRYLVVGDFNTTTHAQPFRRLFGKYVPKMLPTWRADNPLFMLPIDHAIASVPITYHRTQMLSSDHAGLLIDL